MVIERVSVWSYQAHGQKLYVYEARPPRGSNIKPIQRRGFKTYEVAVRAGMVMRDQLDKLLDDTLDPTTEEACKIFIDSSRGSVKDATLAGYWQIFSLYVIPKLGNLKLSKVSHVDLERLLAAMSQNYRSGTIATVRARIRMLFKFAYVRGWITKNPADQIRRFEKATTRESQVQPPWSPEEARCALEAFRKTDLNVFVLLSLTLGLRRGEVLALRWSDVDFQTSTVHINKSRGPQRKLNGDWSIGTSEQDGLVKTAGSNRSLPIAGPLVDALRKERDRQTEAAKDLGALWLGGDYVVCGPRGGGYPASKLGKRFKSICRESNLRVIRMHDQRHTAAVLSLIGGSPLEATSEALGHSSTEITKRIYAKHVSTFPNKFARGVLSALDIEPESQN